MIQVKQNALGPFEKHPPTGSHRLAEEERDVANIGRHPGAVIQVFFGDLARIQKRNSTGSEKPVFDLDVFPDFLLEHKRIQ